MDPLHSKSVVVGIDGSQAAVNAAKWAVDEAISWQILATRPHCPVAIIRTSPDGTAAKPGVIAVVLNDEPDNDEVAHQAVEEGRRRNATVRQIDRRLNSWVRRYPDVPVQVVAAGTGMKSSENRSSAIELDVVGRADADQLAELATPNCHPIMGNPDCPVFIIRD
jgi:nucleotide-binding universal stress UspA family protein